MPTRDKLQHPERSDVRERECSVMLDSNPCERHVKSKQRVSSYMLIHLFHPSGRVLSGLIPSPPCGKHVRRGSWDNTVCSAATSTSQMLQSCRGSIYRSPGLHQRFRHSHTLTLSGLTLTVQLMLAVCLSFCFACLHFQTLQPLIQNSHSRWQATESHTLFFRVDHGLGVNLNPFLIPVFSSNNKAAKAKAKLSQRSERQSVSMYNESTVTS